MKIEEAAFAGVVVDRSGPVSLQRQIFEQIRDLILSGRTPAGLRLPSSRKFSVELGVSRNSVTAAFDQLIAEGYVEARTGAGSFVTEHLPEETLSARAGPEMEKPEAGIPAQVSRRGQILADTRSGRSLRRAKFSPGLPALDHFPSEIWARYLARSWRNPDVSLYSGMAAAGYLPLREAIADYLNSVRAADCSSEQIIIVSGAQQAMAIAAQVLTDHGDSVFVEDPGYKGIHGALLATGLERVPVPVDEEGFDIELAEEMSAETKVASVTPSHQYPLGVTMSLPRRLKLLDWANRTGGWIIEDDYDSEYRYSGRPLAALQGLEADSRVAYIGSFSKVLFPSLRIGYLVVPKALSETFVRVRSALDDHPSAIAQPALARFMQDGHFASHIRKMRRLYQGRRQKLIEVLSTHGNDLFDIDPSESGMHVVVRFRGGFGPAGSDVAAAEKAQARGYGAIPLSIHYSGASAVNGLLLGFASLPDDEIEADAIDLTAAITS